MNLSKYSNGHLNKSELLIFLNPFLGLAAMKMQSALVAIIPVIIHVFVSLVIMVVD